MSVYVGIDVHRKRSQVAVGHLRPPASRDGLHHLPRWAARDV